MDNTSQMPKPFGDAGSAADNMARNAKQGVQAMGDAAHDKIDAATNPAHETVDRAANAAHDTVDKLASNANELSGKLADKAKWAIDAQSEALASSKTWIQDKPLEAVGLAVALGFIIGRMTAH